jgi:hypothetical protein
MVSAMATRTAGATWTTVTLLPEAAGAGQQGKVSCRLAQLLVQWHPRSAARGVPYLCHPGLAASAALLQRGRCHRPPWGPRDRLWTVWRTAGLQAYRWERGQPSCSQTAEMPAPMQGVCKYSIASDTRWARLLCRDGCRTYVHMAGCELP